MKWEKLRKHVEEEVYTTVLICSDPRINAEMLRDLCDSPKLFAPLEECERSLQKCRRMYADKVVEVIHHWDIRMVGKLRELFPYAFPPNLSEGSLHCFVDDKGDWCVEGYKGSAS